MEQEINYGGHSTTPSDYVSKDGDLAVAVNLLNENGSVGVVLPPKVLRQLPSDTAAVYVHDTAKMKHYILVLSNGDIYWADAEGLWGLNDTGYNIQGIEKVVPLGNTLCILSESGMDYLRWNAEEDKYDRLSQNFPELKLSFGLQCEIKSTNLFNMSGTSIDDTTASILNPASMSDEVYAVANNVVMGKVNNLIAECTQQNKFTMPFFVRYAYRLYDGSLTMQSAPILMMPNSGNPLVLSTHHFLCTQGGGGQQLEWYILGEIFHPQYMAQYSLFKAFTPACELDMQLIQQDENFSNYADIIDSIEIFISAPIFTYNQSGDLPRVAFQAVDPTESFGIYKQKDADTEWSDVNTLLNGNYSRRNTFGTLYCSSNSYYSDSDSEEAQYTHEGEITKLKLPSADMMTPIRDCCNFYHLKSIPLGEIGNYSSRTVIDLPDNYLSALTTREVLTDDFDSHARTYPGNIFSYNQRLVLGNLRHILYDGYINQSHTNKYIFERYFKDSDSTRSSFSVDVIQERTGFSIESVSVFVKKEKQRYVAQEEPTPFLSWGRISNVNRDQLYVPYFYYPDADAYQVEVVGRQDNTLYKITLPLKTHDFLNGAYYFNDLNIQTEHPETDAPVTPTTDNNYAQPNKLYTSEVLNPWYFPVEGIVTVGNGEVKALAAATQALSQGQFGQFPLYAFCSDGVWALTVGQTGYFTSSHPVSRDVCTNPDGVTQIDSAVIYPTERGLMLLVGSTNKCFTDELYDKGETTIVNTLTGMDELLTKAGLTRAVLPEVSFIEYMEGCKMVYDYVRQRITVYNPSRYPASPGQTVGERKYKYAYVYSLKTNKWGMVESNLEWTTNSYPEALAMTDDKKLVDVSGERGSSSSVKGLLVTRPLKLGDGDIYKSIHTMIQRGMFERGDVGCVLWGSRDLYHWYLVGSSKTHELRMLRGTGYKYYRIGLLVDLPESKSVSRATVELEGRNMNVVR